MMNDRDIYIALLRLGVEKGLNGITKEDCDQLAVSLKFIKPEDVLVYNSNKTGTKGAEKMEALHTIFVEAFKPQSHGKASILSMESYYKLLDYEELVEARKNSREAKWLAILAIIISGLSLSVSVIGSYYFTKWQIDSPVEIQKEQLEELSESVKVDLTPIEDRIDLLIDSLSNLETK